MKHNVFVSQNPRPIYKPLECNAYSVEQVSLDGRIVSKSCVKTYSPKKMMDCYKVLDFCLENLSANGTELKPVKMSPSAFIASAAVDLSNLKFIEK